MAENIAKSLFKDDITFSSCGIKVISNKISQNAIQVIKDKLKIDLNKSIPKSIDIFYLKDYDTIYSLDKEVSQYLRMSDAVKDNIVEILTDDPYGQNLSNYYDTFNDIYLKIKTIAKEKGSI